MRSAVSSLLSTVRGSQVAILLVALLLTSGPMIVRRFLRPMPNFGRYLFPVLPSIAILMVTGLSAWLRQRHHSHLAVALAAGMLALGIGGLTGFLAPAYARPPVYEDVEAPQPSYRLDRTYVEDGEPLACLLGYDLEQVSVEPGETARVTLHWKVLSETDVDYVLFAQLFGREGVKVGQRDTYPGLGHYPTSFWQPGEVILDEIPIPVASQAVAPSRLRLDVGLYERGAGRLAVTDSQKNVIDTATIGWLKLLAVEQPPSPAVSTDYRLGDAISLHGYDLERESERVLLALHWVSLTPVNRDYMVFVHLLDGEGNVVAQADGPPVGGDYPTSFWAPGETIVGQHMLHVEDLTPGTYELAVGMYLLETGDRLPAADGDGQSLAHDVIPLTRVRLP